jgi:dnd system-associated protein 4
VTAFPNINRSRVYEDLVQKLGVQKIPGTDRSLFPTIREVLCFAALLGFSEKRRAPLDKDAGVEDIAGAQFEREGPAIDLVFMIALAETQDVELLKDDSERRCAEIFEEYANGGLAIIKDHLLQSGGEYPDRAIMAMLKERGYLPATQPEPDLSSIAF